MILVVAEQRLGVVNPVTWETIAAAQQTGFPVKLVVLGSGIDSAVVPLTEARVDEILVVEHDLLEPYTSDAFVAVLAQVVRQEKPEVVLWPHTYQTRDYASKLAARVGHVLIPDCVGTKTQDETLVFVRPMFQGKFVADVLPNGDGPRFASIQIGAYHADSAIRGTTRAVTRQISASIDTLAVRQKPEDPFKEAKQAVDLTQADRIVAVGRGIKDQEHISVAQELAKLLDAELAASRPICDAGWLPMDRQIGSSGQTVAPKLYVALGISGAIQHLVGMKGAQTIVAINKDADAPIFEVADYGIVGDLFEIVPALIEVLTENGSTSS